jgi:hypothetical protein
MGWSRDAVRRFDLASRRWCHELFTLTLCASNNVARNALLRGYRTAQDPSLPCHACNAPVIVRVTGNGAILITISDSPIFSSHHADSPQKRARKVLVDALVKAARQSEGLRHSHLSVLENVLSDRAGTTGTLEMMRPSRRAAVMWLLWAAAGVFASGSAAFWNEAREWERTAASIRRGGWPSGGDPSADKHATTRLRAQLCERGFLEKPACCWTSLLDSNGDYQRPLMALRSVQAVCKRGAPLICVHRRDTSVAPTPPLQVVQHEIDDALLSSFAWSTGEVYSALNRK